MWKYSWCKDPIKDFANRKRKRKPIEYKSQNMQNKIHFFIVLLRFEKNMFNYFMIYYYL